MADAYQLRCVTVQIRDVYERAVSNVPPANEKRYWQRYIYLWINYALFEELEAENKERTREVYRACLKLIPHKIFTFAKANLLTRIPDHLHVPTSTNKGCSAAMTVAYLHGRLFHSYPQD